MWLECEEPTLIGSLVADFVFLLLNIVEQSTFGIGNGSFIASGAVRCVGPTYPCNVTGTYLQFGICSPEGDS